MSPFRTTYGYVVKPIGRALQILQSTETKTVVPDRSLTIPGYLRVSCQFLLQSQQLIEEAVVGSRYSTPLYHLAYRLLERQSLLDHQVGEDTGD